MKKRSKEYIQVKKNGDIKINHVENLEKKLQQEGLSNQVQSDQVQSDQVQSDVDKKKKKNLSKYMKSGYDEIILLNKDQIKELKKKGKTSLVIKGKSKKKMFVSRELFNNIKANDVNLYTLLLRKCKGYSDSEALFFQEQIYNTKIYIEKKLGILIEVNDSDDVKLTNKQIRLNSKQTGYVLEREFRFKFNVTFQRID